MTELNRRRFLQVTAAGAVATSVLGTSALTKDSTSRNHLHLDFSKRYHRGVG